MAKKALTIQDDDEIFDPEASVDKLPYDIHRGRTTLQDFMNIPVDQIVLFQGKGNGDFSRMAPEDFAQMVATIQQDGILEPLTARVLDQNSFELLAGETRLAAAKEAGLTSVPVHIVRNCDDNKALRIFTVTNINRRNATPLDLAYGCYMYWTAIKAQPGNKEELFESDCGELGGGVTPGNLRLRQIRKYHKIYSLGEPFLSQIADGTLAVDAAYAIAFLTPVERTWLKDERYTIAQAERFKSLSKRGELTEDIIRHILHKEVQAAPVVPPTVPMKKAVKQFRAITQSQLRPDKWDSLDAVMCEAMQLYFAKHPEDCIST